MVRDIADILGTGFPVKIGGKTYRIPPASIETGIYVQKVVEAATGLALGEDLAPDVVADLHLPDDDDGGADFYQRMLGAPLIEEMRADRVPWEYLQIAARTAFLWAAQGRDAAEEFWAAGGRPEARRPTPRDRRPAGKKHTKKSKSGRQGSPGGKTRPSTTTPG